MNKQLLKGFSSCTLMTFIPLWDSAQWLKIPVRSFILPNFQFIALFIAVYSDLHRIGTPLSSLLWTFGLMPLYSYLLPKSFYFRRLIKKSISQSTTLLIMPVLSPYPVDFFLPAILLLVTCCPPWCALFNPIALVHSHTANSCFAYWICQT